MNDPKQKWRNRLLRGAAAVLALVFVLGVILYPEGGGGTVASAHAIAEAKYPKMEPYPQGEGTPEFHSSYERWQESVAAQRQPEGYSDGLGNYFTETARQFLSGIDGKNKVYSPLNVYMALAMLAEVSGGNTRQQILDLLGSESIDSLRQQATSVWNAQYRDDGAVTRVLASSLWLNEDIDFVQSTMDTLAETYYASSYRGTMGSAKFDAALQGWIDEQTGGLLTEQAGQIRLDPRTILAIATTIYYKAAWSSKFNVNATTQDLFHAAGGDVTCDFMHQSGVGTYYWGDKFSAISRGMKVNGGTMWFILPDEGYTPDDLLADEQTMEFLLSGGQWEDQKRLIVNQSIPRFDVVSEMDLSAGLKALGITDAFDPQLADYTPMTTMRDDICLSKAQHDARVIIDEEGVEAAAFTVLAMAGSAMPPKDEVDFVVNRPFLFLITGADNLPLFAGVVNNP